MIVETILMGCGLVIAIVGTISITRILWRVTGDMIAPLSTTTHVAGFLADEAQAVEGDNLLCK